MCPSDPSAFSWGSAVSGIVGVAGIGGTLLATYLASREAEKRRLAEQRHDDRTRFHKERVEIYARFISTYKTYRDSIRKHRWPLLPSDEGSLKNVPPPQEARAAFSDVRETVLLVAAKNVVDVADRIFGAALTLENEGMTDSTFEQWDQTALTGLVEFRKAARAEVAPD
jgi:hypothetical protein